MARAIVLATAAFVCSSGAAAAPTLIEGSSCPARFAVQDIQLLQKRTNLGKERKNAIAGASQPAPCCRAVTASCLACALNTTVEDFCRGHGEARGCEGATPAAPAGPDDTPCCSHLTAECLACMAKLPVEDFCAAAPGTQGCAGFATSPGTAAPAAQGGAACCRAATAACMACATNQTTEDFCMGNPGIVGCDELMSKHSASVKEFCSHHANLPGCEAFATKAAAPQKPGTALLAVKELASAGWQVHKDHECGSQWDRCFSGPGNHGVEFASDSSHCARSCGATQKCVAFSAMPLRAIRKTMCMYYRKLPHSLPAQNNVECWIKTAVSMTS